MILQLKKKKESNNQGTIKITPDRKNKKWQVV